MGKSFRFTHFFIYLPTIMFLGKIIGVVKNIDIPDFIEVTTSLEGIENCETPLLIIGKDTARSIFGKQVRVLDKTIDSERGFFWTYDREVKRAEYNKDINNFKNYVISNANKKLRYQYYNLLTTSYHEAKAFIRYILKGKSRHIYETDKHIYIYDERSVIYGLSKMDIQYLGIKVDKIMNRIFSTSKNKYLNNFTLSDDMNNRIGSNNILRTYFLYLEQKETDKERQYG